MNDKQDIAYDLLREQGWEFDYMDFNICFMFKRFVGSDDCIYMSETCYIDEEGGVNYE